MYAADEDTTGQQQPLELIENVLVVSPKGECVCWLRCDLGDVRAAEPQKNRRWIPWKPRVAAKSRALPREAILPGWSPGVPLRYGLIMRGCRQMPHGTVLTKNCPFTTGAKRGPVCVAIRDGTRAFPHLHPAYSRRGMGCYVRHVCRALPYVFASEDRRRYPWRPEPVEQAPRRLNLRHDGCVSWLSRRSSLPGRGQICSCIVHCKT